MKYEEPRIEIILFGAEVMTTPVVGDSAGGNIETDWDQI